MRGESGEIYQDDSAWDAEVDRLVESIEAGEQFEAWMARINEREPGLKRVCQMARVPGCVERDVVSPDSP